MAKLKLNLPTGMVAEKTIVTCFEVNNKSYLILDAENIGSMGLPIILVCKIENNVVKKITDSGEWQQAKDYLKGIIAGNSMNYVVVAPELAADEVYYTQLTLPLASFDVIKNSYKVENEVGVSEEAPVVESVVSEVSAPVVEQPKVEEVAPGAPVIDIVMPTNTNAIEPVVSNAQSVVEDPVIPEIPVVGNDTKVNNAVDFNDSKEAFMKACENMFDALVAKFQSELDSKK